MKAVVVGGGVMGLSTARGLAKLGHEVTVLEQGAIPNPFGSSGDQHRLIRFSYGEEAGYARMVAEAYAAWERLWADLHARHYVETGQLVLTPEDDTWLAGSLRSLRELDVAHELLTPARAAERFPVLRPDGPAAVLHSPTGGVLLASRITEALAGWLREQGAVVRTGTRAVEIDAERGRVALEGGEEIEADTVVVAAGPWIPRLVPALAEAVVPSRQVVAYVEPPASVAALWLESPMILEKDTAAGHALYVVPPVAGTGLKIGDHRFSRGGDPDHAREPQADELGQLLQLSARSLRDAQGYRLDHGRTCFYTVSDDEGFRAHQEGRLLAISPCSGHGFKFGAVIGERTAEVAAGRRDAGEFAAWLAGGRLADQDLRRA